MEHAREIDSHPSAYLSPAKDTLVTGAVTGSLSPQFPNH